MDLKSRKINVLIRRRSFRVESDLIRNRENEMKCSDQFLFSDSV